MKLNEIKYRAKSSLTFLSKSALSINQKKAVNDLIDMYNAFENILDLNPNSKAIDTMLLLLFLRKYIVFKNPQVAIKEVMKDISDGFNIDTQLEHAKYDVAHQIQFNQKRQFNDAVTTFIPLVDEVLEVMKKEIEWIK